MRIEARIKKLETLAADKVVELEESHHSDKRFTIADWTDNELSILERFLDGDELSLSEELIFKAKQTKWPKRYV